MTKFLAFVGLVAILGAIAAAIFFFGGFYNVAGTATDPEVVNPSSGISLGDALRLPKLHPACRRRERGPRLQSAAGSPGADYPPESLSDQRLPSGATWER
jgi:hypothetical protein